LCRATVNLRRYFASPKYTATMDLGHGGVGDGDWSVRDVRVEILRRIRLRAER
jgi:hypothetical protein